MAKFFDFFEMIQIRLLITNTFLAICILSFCGAGMITHGPCQPIDMKVGKEYHETSGGTIAIDLKDLKMNALSINLIKPGGKKVLDAKTLEFKNLERGEYIVIVTGRSEDDDYCPTYIKLSIE